MVTTIDSAADFARMVFRNPRRRMHTEYMAVTISLRTVQSPVQMRSRPRFDECPTTLFSVVNDRTDMFVRMFRHQNILYEQDESRSIRA